MEIRFVRPIIVTIALFLTLFYYHYYYSFCSLVQISRECINIVGLNCNRNRL